MRSLNGIDKAKRSTGARFVVGRDLNGCWTVRESEGLAGGYFRSKEAAMRYARSEAGGSPGAVKLTLAPQELIFGHGRLGKGEGLPAWWRLGRATAGMRSYSKASPIIAGLDRGWLMLDAALVAMLAVLCVTVGAALF
jgi:hypothetical protein